MTNAPFENRPVILSNHGRAMYKTKQRDKTLSAFSLENKIKKTDPRDILEILPGRERTSLVGN